MSRRHPRLGGERRTKRLRPEREGIERTPRASKSRLGDGGGRVRSGRTSLSQWSKRSLDLALQRGAAAQPRKLELQTPGVGALGRRTRLRDELYERGAEAERQALLRATPHAERALIIVSATQRRRTKK